MLSGRRLDILDPSPLDVELDDIAHGLARVARWNGQTSGPFVFSVAQHSCLVEAIALEAEPALSGPQRLAVLLHDAPEYVMGDVITPLKAALGDHFRAIEGRLLGAVYLSFGLPAEPPAALARLIKRADRTAACLEATALAGFSQAEAATIFGRPDPVPDSVTALLAPWAPEDAAARFRERVAAAAPGTANRPGRPCQPPAEDA
ncbi:HD family hydrolase [Enterovirga sp.]|jgi:5'-deoxynucleotidase YfbR-like HD superfamily hydrolase|uniref:HD family hydrolase n=1 Tax=Enterovirga sp. TaxID=2026350 RepID=UPI002612F985|nr:HD family hydrolase [Enterovirga sp.]MDB5589661.1 hydrolase [Enterovirga sp.]